MSQLGAIHFVIPARGGSKVVPDKNMRMVGGRPLISWTIEAARAAAGDVPVVVNSDSEKILDISESFGAQTYKRPEWLAEDQTSMRDVLADYFRAHAEVETIVVLYPTCPFRTADSIRKALNTYQYGKHKSLMSVSASLNRPFGGVQIINGKMSYDDHAEAWYRKQDTPAIYYANGAIFIMDRDELSSLNTQLFNKETYPFILQGHEGLDIDTETELEVAQALAQGGFCGRIHNAEVGVALESS